MQRYKNKIHRKGYKLIIEITKSYCIIILSRLTMKHVPIILLIGLLFWACGNKSQQDLPPSDVEEGWGEKYQKELDSVREKTIVPDKEPPSKSYTPSSHSSSTYSSSRDDDYDNMRGFDPASEDDMDDNGMSRYMENNDDEGWD